MAKKSRQFSTSDFTPEQVASNPALKKAYEEALAEETKLAAEKKAAAAEKRKEQKAIRDAEKQVAKQTLDEVKETKKASTASTTAARDKQKRVEKQNRLENVTRRLPGADRIEGVVSGTARNIARTVTSSITGSTGLRNLAPRAVAANTLQAAGLGSLIALSPLFGGGRRDSKPDSRPPVGIDIAPLIIGFKLLEVKLDNINNSIVNTNEYLQDLIAGQSQAARARIEEDREKRAQRAPRGEGVTAVPTADGKGGILSALSGLLPSIGSLLPNIGSITKVFTPLLTGLSNIFKGLLRFSTTVALPIAALVAIFTSLEQKDWSEIFGNLSKVFDDLSKGKFLDAFVRLIGTISDTLITGAGRLVADILDFFGLESVAKSINDFLDTVDIGTTYVNAVQAITDYVVNAFYAAKDTVSGWINTAFDVGQKLIDWAIGLKDSIVNKFSNAKDEIIAWWESFSLSALLTEKFEEIKNKIINFVGQDNLQKVFDVLDFNVGGYISEKLGEVVDKIKNMFAGITDTIGNFLYEKGKLFEKIGLSNPFEGFKSQATAATAGATPQSSFSAMAAAGPSVPLTAQTSYREVPIDMGEGVTSTTTEAITTFKPTVNTKNLAMVAQSGFAAMAAAGPPQVVVLPGSGTMNSSREPSTPPRISSGAVSTAPAPSLMDQSLYGFGANYY